MTIGQPHVMAAHDTPPRRLRKRWIILAAFCALLLFSGWLIFHERTLAVMRVPDGRRFTIHKLTYGLEHSYQPKPVPLTTVENWANRWLVRIGRQISESHRMWGSFSITTPTIAVWHSFDWSQKSIESTPSVMVLTDSHGWRTSISLVHLQNTPPPVPSALGQPVAPFWISSPMLSLSPELQVALLNARGDRLATARLPYAVPKFLQQQWTAQSFPVMESDGNVRVTLSGLHAVWAKLETVIPIGGDVLTVTPEYVVTVDGNGSTSWAPLTEGVPFFEMVGSMKPTAAIVQSPQGASASLTHCTVSPHEPLWKLHLPFTCQNPDEVLSSDRVSLGRAAFAEGKSAVAELSAAVTVGKSTVQLLGAGRAGSFAYEGAGESNFPMPVPQPIEYWTGNRLKGTFQATNANAGNFPIASASLSMRQPQLPMTIDVKFTAPRPTVVISLSDSGDRFPFVIVKDELGRLLEGELFNAQGLLIWLAKETCDDVQQVDVTLLLQKPRNFTFVVLPPTVPPRLAGELK